MTEEQKEFLKRVSFNKQPINEGSLNEEQQEYLRQYNAGMQYLADKYPGTEFHIVSGEGTTAAKDYYTYLFFDSRNEEDFNLLVHPLVEEGGEYLMADDYYESVIGEECERIIGEALQSKGIDAFNIKFRCRAFLGNEHGANMKAMESLTGVVQTENDVLIYIDENAAEGSSFENAVSIIRTTLEEKHFIGFFTVIICEQTDEERSVYRDTFSL